MNIFWDMVRCMEKDMNVKAKCVCLATEWSLNPPPEASGLGIASFLSPEVAETLWNGNEVLTMAQISTQTYVYSFWDQLKSFWLEYQKVFAQKPYLPLPRHVDTW
jgi:hypothetical protein